MTEPEARLHALYNQLAEKVEQRGSAKVVITLIDQLVEQAIGGTNPALVTINKVHFYERVLTRLGG